jgi:large subunit ribosomal protein L29
MTPRKSETFPRSRSRPRSARPANQLLQVRLRKQTGQVEKTHELRSLRKDVARLETILRQKNKPAPAAA